MGEAPKLDEKKDAKGMVVIQGAVIKGADTAEELLHIYTTGTTMEWGGGRFGSNRYQNAANAEPITRENQLARNIRHTTDSGRRHMQNRGVKWPEKGPFGK